MKRKETSHEPMPDNSIVELGHTKTYLMPPLSLNSTSRAHY